MVEPITAAKALVLIPMVVIIGYYDIRYRRIPNPYVLVTLVAGLTINLYFGGLSGLGTSLGGGLLAFGLLFAMFTFGAMGAGDVKLFAAIGAVLGLKLVLPTLLIISLVGGLLAVYSMVRARRVRATLVGVTQILIGLLPGWKMPRFEIPSDRRYTIPYGVAITIGSLVSLFAFTQLR